MEHFVDGWVKKLGRAYDYKAETILIGIIICKMGGYGTEWEIMLDPTRTFSQFNLIPFNIYQM
jgi:hypothetical protein